MKKKLFFVLRENTLHQLQSRKKGTALTVERPLVDQLVSFILTCYYFFFQISLFLILFPVVFCNKLYILFICLSRTLMHLCAKSVFSMTWTKRMSNACCSICSCVFGQGS